MICLKGRERDIKNPEENEDYSCGALGALGTAQLRSPARQRGAPVHEDGDGQNGDGGVDEHAEAEGAGIDAKLITLEIRVGSVMG